MTLPPEVTKSLTELFSWAAQDYLEAIKEQKLDDPGFFSYDVEQPEIQKHLAPIKEYFLDPAIWNTIHVCHHDRVKGRKPPPLNEELFARALEQLLLWAAISLSTGIPKPAVEDFIKQFESELTNPPRKLSYVPIYGTYVESQSDFHKPFVLATGIVARNLLLEEHRFLKNECRGISLDPKDRHKTDLPMWVIEIDHEETNKAGLKPENIKDTISRFVVLARGLFHAQIRLPIRIEGHKTAWYPFDYEGASLPSVAVSPGWRNGFSDMEIRAFRKHWETGNFEPLERFRIATSRLEMAEERTAWHDQLIDLCIALESIFGFDSTYKLAVGTAALMEEKYESRERIYTLIKKMFKWRGKVVHGDPEITKFQKKTTPSEFKKDLAEFKRCISQILLIQLLNPELRKEESVTARVLGSGQPIVRVPTMILQAKASGG